MNRLRVSVLWVTLISSVLLFTACNEQVANILKGLGGGGPLTEQEVVSGLKKALDIGIDNSVTTASGVDGYLKNQAIKILLPSDVQNLREKIEAKPVISAAYNVYTKGFNNGEDLFDELIVGMNRGAEKAAPKAVSIFANAVRRMTITQAFDILNGGQTAATDFFYSSTKASLYQAFNPEVKKALDGTGANQVYTRTVNFLNYRYDPTGTGLITATPNDVLKLELAESIDEYATNKAIDGLFYLIAEEEKKIRENPYKWGSAIIERVFGS